MRRDVRAHVQRRLGPREINGRPRRLDLVLPPLCSAESAFVTWALLVPLGPCWTASRYVVGVAQARSARQPPLPTQLLPLPASGLPLIDVCGPLCRFYIAQDPHDALSRHGAKRGQ